MATQKEAIDAIHQHEKIFEPKIERIPAILGDGNGIVIVPGRGATWQFARPRGLGGGAQIVYNNVTAPRHGLPVLLVKDPTQPQYYKVYDTQQMIPGYGGYPGGGGLRPHHEQHEWGNSLGGDDIVNVRLRQVRDGIAWPTDPPSLSVVVYDAIYELEGNTYYYAGGTLDLTTHVPTEVGGQCYVLICLGPSGPVAVTGETVGTVSLDDIPQSPGPAYWRIAAVMLYHGMTEITEWPDTQHILDLRFTSQQTGQLPGGARGDIIRREASTWDNYRAANFGHILVGNGVDVVSVLVTGDLAIESTGSPGEFTVEGIWNRSIAPTQPTDGQAYLWDESENQWVPGDVIPESITNVSRTIGSGKDHATIQDAADWCQGKLINGICTLLVDVGAYDEAVVFEGLFIGSSGGLKLVGDTRVLAGLTYVDTHAANQVNGNQAGLTNGGSGYVTLSSAGNNITATMSVTNPDFDADNWTNGDKILVYDNSGTTTEYTIDSVANNVITLTVAAPAIGNDGTAICLLPNRRIERTTAGPCITTDMVRGILVDGFYLETATGANCHGIYAINGGMITGENIVAKVEDHGFYAYGAASRIGVSDGACSAWNCARGFWAQQTAKVIASYSVAVACSTYGYYANTFSFLEAAYAIAVEAGTAGFISIEKSMLYAAYATARQDTTGYYASYDAFLHAPSTNANNNGNGTNYNPAPTPPGSAQGNNYAVIYAS